MGSLARREVESQQVKSSFEFDDKCQNCCAVAKISALGPSSESILKPLLFQHVPLAVLLVVILRIEPSLDLSNMDVDSTCAHRQFRCSEQVDFVL